MASHSVSPARAVVAESLASVSRSFIDFDPDALSCDRLDLRDRRLALRIGRHAMQRWITIEHLLDRIGNQPLWALEPMLRGILVSAAAQLVFMDRQPAHAVVNDSVQLARDRIRPGAGGLVNAVLRRLSGLVDQRVTHSAWTPGPDRLPLEDGYLRLVEPCLPPPGQWLDHLTLATSHPSQLVARWSKQYGRAGTVSMCLQGLRTPPTIVAVERDFDQGALAGATEPHADERFVLWHRSRDELTEFLRGHSDRRVQDPATAEPVSAVVPMAPARCVLDYCAGRGTKTAQLLGGYGDARIVATDICADRRAALRRRFSDRANLQVAEPGALQPFTGGVDLLVLDVPCSNTAVLARRPEARYRYGRTSVDSLVALQRQIATSAIRLLAPGGTVLYITCSLDEAENQQQVRWMAERFRLHVLQSVLRPPRGRQRSYSDGCFYAVLRRRSQ